MDRLIFSTPVIYSCKLTITVSKEVNVIKYLEL
jgi:hypothetical protein